MFRWLMVIALALVAAPAVAQGQGAPTATAQTQTRTAQADVVRVERLVAAATAKRNALNARWQEQLKAVDRLKQQRASWRRDRELKDALAAAQATATQLSAAASELGRVTTQLTAVRRTLLVAIDRELATNPPDARAAELQRQKQQLAPAPKRSVAKIVLPDMQIDPYADPEELDAQAAELRRAEQELERQAIGLDKQARELRAQAELKKQHDRAALLAQRDDDQPQRTARVSSGGGRQADLAGDDSPPNEPVSGGPAPGGNDDAGDGGGGQEGGGGFSNPTFEAEATVVLSNVVDAATIETLSRASRSGDPATRAQAAKRTSDAVKARLEQLRKKRAEIEAAAKARRR